MQNLFDDSDDNSDDVSVSNRRLSKSIIPNFEENDDAREKAKRKSMLIEKDLNNKRIIYQVNTTQKFTKEQIGSHYGNCIKLASENKINSKNAFSLHLIDYLRDYVKELEHFQSVGTSLDAGTKIYAGRVDSIHQNTYQVLTGLGNPSDEKLETVEEVAPQDDPVSGDENEAKTKKPKRKVNIIRNTISQNLKKLRINHAQIRSEVDPLFQSEAENFDEGGNCELRCNNLALMDKTYDLLLDSEKIFYTNAREDPSHVNNDNMEYFDLSSFNNILANIRDGQYKLSEHFDDFIFTGWNELSEIMNSTTAESFRNMSAASKLGEIMETDADHHGDHHEDIEVDMNYGFDNDDHYGDVRNDFDGNEINEEKNIQEPMKEDKVEDDDDNLVIIGTSRSDNTGNVFMSSVRDLVNSFVENYGEINENMLGTWAGSLHWRQKAKPIKAPKADTEKKANQAVKQPKDILPIFPEKIETRSNKDGIGRMVLKDSFKFTKSETVSTQLSDVCLSKNMAKEALLAPRTLFNQKSINHLMNREISLVNKVLKNHVDKLSLTEVNCEEKVFSCDYNKQPDEVMEFGTKPATLLADDDGNVTIHDNMDFDDDGRFSDDDGYVGNSFRNADFDNINDQAPVTADVRRIEQIDIDYAKRAKRINVKKLKNEIWVSLRSTIKAEEIQIIKEKKYPDVQMVSDTSLFSDMLVEVDGKMSNEASRELSVGIMMTCLLHMANETGLDLVNTADYSDLIIGQGYSDYDYEQIKKFGIGNGLINDTRKRKSSLDIVPTVKRKAAHNNNNNNNNHNNSSLFSDVSDELEIDLMQC